MQIFREGESVYMFLYIKAYESSFSALVWNVFSGKCLTAIIQSGNKSELAARHKHASLFSCTDEKLQIQSQFFLFFLFVKHSPLWLHFTLFFSESEGFKSQRARAAHMSLLSNLASPPLRGASMQMRLIKFERLFFFLSLVLNPRKVSSE